MPSSKFFSFPEEIDGLWISKYLTQEEQRAYFSVDKRHFENTFGVFRGVARLPEIVRDRAVFMLKIHPQIALKNFVFNPAINGVTSGSWYKFALLTKDTTLQMCIEESIGGIPDIEERSKAIAKLKQQYSEVPKEATIDLTPLINAYEQYLTHKTVINLNRVGVEQRKLPLNLLMEMFYNNFEPRHEGIPIDLSVPYKMRVVDILPDKNKSIPHTIYITKGGGYIVRGFDGIIARGKFQIGNSNTYPFKSKYFGGAYSFDQADNMLREDVDKKMGSWKDVWFSPIPVNEMQPLDLSDLCTKKHKILRHDLIRFILKLSNINSLYTESKVQFPLIDGGYYDQAQYRIPKYKYSNVFEKPQGLEQPYLSHFQSGYAYYTLDSKVIAETFRCFDHAHAPGERDYCMELDIEHWKQLSLIRTDQLLYDVPVRLGNLESNPSSSPNI